MDKVFATLGIIVVACIAGLCFFGPGSALALVGGVFIVGIIALAAKGGAGEAVASTGSSAPGCILLLVFSGLCYFGVIWLLHWKNVTHLWPFKAEVLETSSPSKGNSAHTTPPPSGSGLAEMLSEARASSEMLGNFIKKQKSLLKERTDEKEQRRVALLQLTTNATSAEDVMKNESAVRELRGYVRAERISEALASRLERAKAIQSDLSEFIAELQGLLDLGHRSAPDRQQRVKDLHAEVQAVMMPPPVDIRISEDQIRAALARVIPLKNEEK